MGESKFLVESKGTQGDLNRYPSKIEQAVVNAGLALAWVGAAPVAYQRTLTGIQVASGLGEQTPSMF